MGKSALLLIAAGMLVIACDNDFSPKTDFERKLVVFCVLEPTQDMQVVRLAWSYDADIGVPLRPLTPVEVGEAAVFIRQGGNPYRFTDTVLTAADGSLVRTWISRELKPKNETEHRLEVSVPGYPRVTHALTTPSRMYVSAEGVKADTGEGWMRLSSGISNYKVRPGGFYFRAWLVVTVRENGVVNERRAEIPLHMATDRDQWVYPSPAKEDEVFFDIRIIRRIANLLFDETEEVVTKQIITRGYTMNNELYSYYKVVRGFDDPVTMRLDKPDIAFIDGALGVFGAALPDSATFPLSRFVK
ncbi:MAG: DUF4249 domain-containing protein [Bacteroidia bacterium]|nr:DUF4249 domain-containing protein [Bacteroidia bacterium]